MIEGKKYEFIHALYDSPRGRARKTVAYFLEENDKEYILSGRPHFGTMRLSKEFVHSVKAARSDERVVANRLIGL